MVMRAYECHEGRKEGRRSHLPLPRGKLDSRHERCELTIDLAVTSHCCWGPEAAIHNMPLSLHVETIVAIRY